MQIRSSLMDLVLPLESRHNVSSTVLQRLETSVSEADTLTEAQWAEAAGAATQVPRKLLKLVYQLCADFSNRKDNISSSLLVFTLFLQNISSTRKRRLGEKKKHAVEELLLQFIKDSYDTLTFIFKLQQRLDSVLNIIFFDYNPAVSLDVEKMTHDSHGVVSCIKNGKKLVWKLGNPHTSGLARMATTAHLSGAGDRKKIVLSQLIRQTLVKSSGSVRGSSVLVHRGNQSQLYLAAILRSLDVSKCRGCVVVAGPVRNTLRVSGCRGVTVVAAARRVVVEQSADTTLYLLTPAPPLVAASCNNITFGPFNLNYDGLRDDLSQVGLDCNVDNLWSAPEVVTSANESPLPSSIFKLKNPVDFDQICFPLNIKCEEIVPECPQEYLNSIEKRTSVVERWEEEVAEAGLTLAEENTLQALIDRDFNTFVDNHYEVLCSNIQYLAG